jgi:hypothetical protein
MEPLIVLSTLLLMIYGSSMTENDLDRGQWINLAVSISYKFRLHKYPTNGDTLLSHTKRSAWKRLWWSCYIVDRLLALEEGRDPHIRDESWDVPMISIDDLRVDQSELWPHLGQTQQLARTFVERALLCFPRKATACSASLPSTSLLNKAWLEMDFETELIYHIYNRSDENADVGSPLLYSHRRSKSEEVELINYISQRASGDLGWNDRFEVFRML